MTETNTFTRPKINARTLQKVDSDVFKHPILTTQELQSGCKFILDSGADSCVAGKHAHVLEFVEGHTVSAQSFNDSAPPLTNMKIANVLFAYDLPNLGQTILLRVNHAIYLGDHKEDSLLCPHQLRVHGLNVDDRPQYLSPDDDSLQRIQNDALDIPLRHNGPTMFFFIRRPTPGEIEDTGIPIVDLTSPFGWDPYGADSIESFSINQVTHLCSISTFLSSNRIYVNELRLGKKIGAISPKELAKKWLITENSAERTLSSTYQEYLRTTDNLTRRFKTSRAHARYRNLRGPRAQMYTDILFSKVISIRGNTCGQVYTNKLNFYRFYGLKQKRDAHTTLKPILELTGIFERLHSDNAKEFKEGIYAQLLKEYRIPLTVTEPYSPWQNRGEIGVREIKKLGKALLRKANAPLRLWDFAFEHAANILSLTATGEPHLGNRTGYELVTQITPDISPYISFDWYEWCWFWDEIQSTKQLGKWLGVAEGVGQVMTFWILKQNGQYIARSSVISLSQAELDAPANQRLLSNFSVELERKIGDHNKALVDNNTLVDASDPVNDNFLDDLDIQSMKEDSNLVQPWDSRDSDIPKEATSMENAMEELDEFIGAKVKIMTSDGEQLVTVSSRKRDHSGSLIGKKNNNPILDSRVYNVEFPDGHYGQYSANILAESIYSSVDEDGYDCGHLDKILDHRKNKDAISKSDGYFYSHTGQRRNKVTTAGWDLEVQWRDGSTSWLPLKVLKETVPLLIAEYAKANNIMNEPAFRWWATHVLKKSTHIVQAMKSMVRKGHSKFGIQVPRTVEEALLLDKKNGNDLWEKALAKEMKNVKIAFEFYKPGARPPVGHKEIRCFLIWDVKMDLTRKARFVASGKLTDPPSSMTYASVVSRESVRIAFLIAAMNGLEILAGDIGNAYLNALTDEKIYYRAGKEWGEHTEGCVCVIKRALYGLRSSANRWRAHISSTLKNKMHFNFSLADNDVWMKEDIKSDGTRYYSYILIYTDDILILSETPKRYMDQLKRSYFVKPDSIKTPDIYLGGEIKMTKSRTGSPCYSISCNKYCQEAVKTVFNRMREVNLKLNIGKASPENPFSNLKYKPELDMTPNCNSVHHQFYQQIIGILRWMIELGRIDIMVEVSLLSRYLAAPRYGHLAQALHVCSYIKSNDGLDICFDPTKITIIENNVLPHETAEIKSKSLRELYPDARDNIPPNMPEPLGNSVQLNAFVDADHAGELTTRRSQTGIIVYGNMAPLIFYSKRQNTVESSTFGSEFVAMRILVDIIHGLRYKLRMFGVPLDGPANVFCDNEAVYKSSMRAESVLKKKNLSISYHKTREAIASKVLLVYFERTNTNHSDLFTKVLSKEKIRELMGYICGKTAY